MPAHIMQETDRAVFRFSYDETLIGELKVKIPSRYRKWDPDEKAWTITEPWVKTATNLCVAHFGARAVTLDDRRPGAAREPDPPPPSGGSRASDGGDRQTIRDLQRQLTRERAARESAQRDAERYRRQASSSSSTSSSRGGDWAAGLFRALPPEMSDRVYKRLLAALHPDTNGGSAAAEQLTKSLNQAFRNPKSGR